MIWTEPARDDLQALERYITEFRPVAARRLAQRILDAAESLIELPERGIPAGRGVRVLAAISPYLIRYRLDGETIYILRIRHAAQRRR